MSIERYHLGCPLWSHKPWVGHFYSSDAKPADFLIEYSSVFNAVEGNSTFYGLPAESTFQKWRSQTPDGFKFCFKFPQTITHEKRLRECDDELDEFFGLMEIMEDRLGPIFIQLPGSFSPDEFPHLERFIRDLPSVYSYAVEMRHPEYFDHGRNEHRLNKLLETHHVDRVIFDTRKLHDIKTDDVAFKEIQRRKPKLPVRFETTGSRPVVRFVGANEVTPNTAYLKEWAIIVAEWIKEGLHPYVFIHAPDELHAPDIARYFHRQLIQMTNLNSMPSWPADREDSDAGQLDLF